LPHLVVIDGLDEVLGTGVSRPHMPVGIQVQRGGLLFVRHDNLTLKACPVRLAAELAWARLVF
jgi:hypothetical protein